MQTYLYYVLYKAVCVYICIHTSLVDLPVLVCNCMHVCLINEHADRQVYCVSLYKR